MRKFILAVLVIWFAFYWFKRTVKKNSPPSLKVHPQNDDHIVQCANCQLHVPRSEAYLVEGHFYCCKQHIPSK